MLRVLVLFTSVGGGHRAAATAIVTELRKVPDVQVEVCDVLAFAPPWFAYDRAWSAFQQHGARAWDWLFDVTERGALDLDPVRLPLHAKLFARLDAYLETFRPTHLVCTHYLPAIAAARVAPRIGARTIVTITDHLSHRAWVNRGIDAYCVADRQVARQVERRLAQLGETAEVHVTGIPIARAAADPVQPVEPLGNRVLALLGGLPAADARAAIDALAGIRDRAVLRVLVGSAPALAAYAHAKLPGARIAARADGLLGAIDDADLVITKAGGLTVSECLARGRGMVLPFAAPGQERGNQRYAIDAGAAIGPSLADLGDATVALLAEPNRLRRMGMRARLASHPFAAEDVAFHVLGGEMEVARAA